MKLYFNPQSRATIAKWLLDEAGVDYQVVHVDFQKGEHKAPQFLAINPAGKLPALVDGATKIFENTAICLYIADKVPAARLAPAIDAPERGRYLSLIVYSTAQLEPAMGDAILKLSTAPQRGWADYESCKSVVERELGAGPYLFGDWFTAADIMIGSMFIWQRMLGTGTGRPKLEAYVDRLLQRPKSMKLPGAG
jgi:glutathione S-transferase